MPGGTWAVLSWGTQSDGRTEEGDRTWACSGENVFRVPPVVREDAQKSQPLVRPEQLHGNIAQDPFMAGDADVGEGAGHVQEQRGLASVRQGPLKGPPSPFLHRRCFQHGTVFPLS